MIISEVTLRLQVNPHTLPRKFVVGAPSMGEAILAYLMEYTDDLIEKGQVISAFVEVPKS